MTEKTVDTAIPEDSPDTSKRKKSGGLGKTPLSERQLVQLESMWASGEYTTEQLGKKFGRTSRSIISLLKARGAKKGELSEEITERVREKVVDKIVSDTAIIAERTKETKEDHYRMSSAIAKLTWMEVAKAQKEGRSFATITGSMKALSLAMGVLEKARSERYAVLGLDAEKDDDGEIPELIVNELTQEQIEELRNRDFSAPGQRDAEKLLEEVLDSEDEMKFEEASAEVKGKA